MRYYNVFSFVTSLFPTGLTTPITTITSGQRVCAFAVKKMHCTEGMDITAKSACGFCFSASKIFEPVVGSLLAEGPSTIEAPDFAMILKELIEVRDEHGIAVASCGLEIERYG